MKQYSDLPGVRKMHDFMIVHTTSDKIVMKVRANCHSGVTIDSTLHAVDPSLPGSPTMCYREHTRSVATEKLAQVTQMCYKYIPPTRWPSYIPIQQPPVCSSSSNNHSNVQTSTTSFSTSRQGQPRTTSHGSPPPKKLKKWTTPGCDGSGHTNKKRWIDGHTTKAGCPKYRR